VVAVERSPNLDYGTCRIRAEVGGRVTNVTVTLPGHLYDFAVNAHLQRWTVSVTGLLVQKGNRLTLIEIEGMHELPLG
jgi:hypothetical protein